MEGTEEALERRKAYWKKLYEKDKGLYREIRHTPIACMTELPGKGGRKIAVNGYRVTKKIFKYN